MPSVTSETVANNLIANGYNFYGAYATANQFFQFFQKGTVSGKFLWLDSFINEIWMLNACQLALMLLLQNAKSIPYNSAGSAQMELALADPINDALNFGAIRTGVPLSASQVAAVNAAVGAKVSDTITQRGWYLKINATGVSPTVRAARGSPPCALYYTDGQSVQQINLNAYEIQ